MDFYLTSGRGKLYILDWLTLQEKQCIIAHSSNVYNLKMLADGSKFVTAGGDLLVLIWNTLEKIVCRSISRIEYKPSRHHKCPSPYLLCVLVTLGRPFEI